MSDKGITVKTTIIRSETLHVSREVMRGLRALSMRSIDPLLDSADAVGDALLRDKLNSMPEVQERQRAIEAFFKQLNKKDTTDAE